MLALIIFILILSVLILIHEFGHYIVAKKSGVLVEEFGLGIPPKLFGKKIGETEYTLNALPFGGFVRLFGEDLEDATEEEKVHPRSFLSKKPWQRALILTAGVLMNLFLALVMYTVLFTFTGYRSLNLPVFFDYEFKYGEVTKTETVVSGFSENSPAENIGVTPGEAIVEIDGIPVLNVEGVKAAVAEKANQEVTVKLKDLKKHTQNATRDLTITTQANEEGRGILGVYIAKSASIHYPNKLLAPLQHSVNMLLYTFTTFGEFISIAFETKSVEPVSTGVSGPVGIYSAVESILSYGGIDAVLGVIDFIGLLSLSLAFMNILPLPALDGGRLIFVFAEMVLGKPLDQKYEATIHRWGMLVLLTFLVLVTIKDVRQLFS